MKIVKATQSDIALIRSIAEKSWRANYAEILSTEQIDYMLDMMYSDAELTSQFGNSNYQYYLIGDSADDYLGIMGFELNYEPDTTKLHRIYLLKESKGKGLGKAAVEFLKRIVAQYGNSRIILNVNKGNPARDFYESLGFRVYDSGVFDIGSGFVMDDYLMEFIL